MAVTHPVRQCLVQAGDLATRSITERICSCRYRVVLADAGLHGARWVVRLATQAEDLRAAATAANWESGRARTLTLARSLYAHLPDGSPVWNATNDIVAARRDELASLLTTVSG